MGLVLHRPLRVVSLNSSWGFPLVRAKDEQKVSTAAATYLALSSCKCGPIGRLNTEPARCSATGRDPLDMPELAYAPERWGGTG